MPTVDSDYSSRSVSQLAEIVALAALEIHSQPQSSKYSTPPPSAPSSPSTHHSPSPAQSLSGLSYPEKPSVQPDSAPVVSTVIPYPESRATVGGTSLAAFLPGFFLGGRTQVLLNAPFEITSGNDISLCPVAAEGGENICTVSLAAGRGARGVASVGLKVESGDIEKDIFEARDAYLLKGGWWPRDCRCGRPLKYGPTV